MRAAVVLILGVWASACSDPCTRADLQARLDAARAGDVVELGSCTIAGPVRVPAGVTFRGAAASPPTIVAAEGTVGVELAGTLESVAIESAGNAGIAVRSGASAIARGVQIRATRGIAIGVERGTLELDGVHMYGEVLSTNADDPRWLRVLGAPVEPGPCPVASCECEPGTTDGDQTCDSQGHHATLTATHGIYATNAAITGMGLTIEGFASAGIVADHGTLELHETDLTGCLGLGIEVIGGSSDAANVHVNETGQGVRGEPSYAVLAADGASLTSDGLTLSANDRYGLVQLGSTGVHTGFASAFGGDAAVWVADSTRFDLSGSVRDALFAGIVVVDSSHVHLSDAEVNSVTASTRPVGLIGAIQVGDGLHVIGSYDDVTLSRVTVQGAARAGLLVDVGGTTRPTFDAVRVTAAGAQLGAIAGTPDSAADGLAAAAPAGWDTGIVRMGTAAANDAAFTGTMPAVLGARPPSSDELLGVVAPMF